MKKIITIGNTKGGVGKSTLAANFAVEASKDGLKVLLVDADPQGSTMGFRGLRETDDIAATAITTPTLHKDLKGFDFDLIVVDAGGRDAGAFRSAITAADFLLVPCLPSQYDVWATGDTIKILEEARIYREIKSAMVLNQVIPNTKVGREAREAVQEFAEACPLTETTLFSRVAFKNSLAEGLGVSEFEPTGKAAHEFRALYDEVMKAIGG